MLFKKQEIIPVFQFKIFLLNFFNTTKNLKYLNLLGKLIKIKNWGRSQMTYNFAVGGSESV